MTKQIDELFFYKHERDKTPRGQREANKPQDKLALRKKKNAVIDDPKGYKDVVKGDKVDPAEADWKKEARTRTKKTYAAGGPKGKLPEDVDTKVKNLIKFFETAGVDITKGKAKELIEAEQNKTVSEE